MKSNAVLLTNSLNDVSFSAFRDSGSLDDWYLFCRYRNKVKNVIRKERQKY